VNIAAVVMEEIDRYFLDRHQFGEELWVCGSHDLLDALHLSLSVGPAPGGAYSHFGSLMVGSYETVFSVKTVWGIMGHRSDKEEFHFEYCDPAFPDNLIAFVKRAAFNTHKCYKLQNKRFWRKYVRTARQTPKVSRKEIGGICGGELPF